jgi:hypothetical protein
VFLPCHPRGRGRSRSRRSGVQRSETARATHDEGEVGTVAPAAEDTPAQPSESGVEMIVKHARPMRWTAVDRRTVNDERLSYRARGLLVWLLDKPPDWEWNATTAAASATEGRDAVRAAMRELEAAGYLVRRKAQLSDGRWTTDTWVLERPEDVPSLPETDFQASAPETGNQASENRASGSQALSSSQSLRQSTDGMPGPGDELEPAAGDHRPEDSISGRIWRAVKRRHDRTRMVDVANVVADARARGVSDAVLEDIALWLPVLSLDLDATVDLIDDIADLDAEARVFALMVHPRCSAIEAIWLRDAYRTGVEAGAHAAASFRANEVDLLDIDVCPETEMVA